MAIIHDTGHGISDSASVASHGRQATPSVNFKLSSSHSLDLNGITSSAIERIVANYVDTLLAQYPCISRSMLDDIVERAKNQELRTPGSPLAHGTLSELDHFEYFVLYIVLAISTMTLTWKSDDQARRSSDSFYNSALTHLQQVEVSREMDALRISLLLAHYAHMCPEKLDNWTCIANAVRIVLNLGLFRKCPETMPADPVRQRSELFWVTYGMERSLCTNIRLPLSFPEDVITADVSRAFHIQVFLSIHLQIAVRHTGPAL